MGRRTARLTMGKASTRHKLNRTRASDSGAAPALSLERWNKMNAYGLFSISDAYGDKFNFRRGEVATILPAERNPGEPIEPHEYWVGKILEIRADAGNHDSEEIWVKVRWFYSAQDAAQLLKSFDTSTIGKFERVLSNHWDFVIPQAFNEIIPMHRLRTFRNQHAMSSRGQLKGKGKAKIDSDSDDTDDEDPESQKPIGPQMFYWRYEVRLDKLEISPKPGSRICLCSTPYLPDDPSPLTGAMHFCPRPSCKTAYHVKCLRDAKSTWVDSEVVVPQSPKKRKLQGKGRGRGRANGTNNRGGGLDTEVMDKGHLEGSDIGTTILTGRAIRLLCSSPDTNEEVDLLGLVRRGSGSGEETLKLLQRIYYRHVLSSTQTKGDAPTNQPRISDTAGSIKLSAGSVAEVENLLTEATVHVNGKRTRKLTSKLARSSPHKNKAHPHEQCSFPNPISPNVLLSTLFLYPLSSTSTHPPPTAIQEHHHDPSQPSSLDHTPTPTPTPTPTSATTTNPEPSSSSSHSHSYPLLLTLASEPLIRWGGVGNDDNDDIEPTFHLGPTGNMNIVLRARRIVWDVLKAVGELNLSTMETFANGDGGGNNDAETKDEKDFLQIKGCVDAVLKDWRVKVSASGIPEKGGLELEDAIFIGSDLDLNLGGGGGGLSAQKVKVEDEGRGSFHGGNEMEKGRGEEEEEEHEAEHLVGKKRRRSGRSSAGAVKGKPSKSRKVKIKVEVEEVSKVDWACPWCGGSI